MVTCTGTLWCARWRGTGRTFRRRPGGHRGASDGDRLHGLPQGLPALGPLGVRRPAVPSRPLPPSSARARRRRRAQRRVHLPRPPGQTLHRLPVPRPPRQVLRRLPARLAGHPRPFSEPASSTPSPGKKSPTLHHHLPDIHPSYAPDGSVASYFRLSDPTDYYFHYNPEEFRGLSFVKLAFSSSPAAGGPHRRRPLRHRVEARVHHRGADRWRLHDDCWCFDDVAFRRGSLLALSGNGDLLAVDLSGGYADVVRLRRQPVRPPCRRTVQEVPRRDDATGDVLQVWRNFDFDDVANTLTTCEIKVMRLDWGTNRWIPISSLGGRALFLGIGSSMLLSPEDVRGLRPNCVYLTDDWWDMLYSEEVRLARRDVGIYCLEDASLQPCHSPDPRFNWPPPVWISPSLS
uniref:KIB1-4 beta-propeller domain-containing protein n=1 Tax=Ananas comosus var. bracteatus TaxID=296719 RepID=A0A6V7Q3A0_ANACO|nr:unnamed protein product [Ananas comosus var. bracteatus]